jgi:hypothetical protein
MASTSVTVWVAAIAALLLTATDARAYLDPGTGSYILQMIVAGLLGAAFAVRMFWARIKRFFAGVFSRSDRNS